MRKFFLLGSIFLGSLLLAEANIETLGLDANQVSLEQPVEDLCPSPLLETKVKQGEEAEKFKPVMEQFLEEKASIDTPSKADARSIKDSVFSVINTTTKTAAIMAAMGLGAYFAPTVAQVAISSLVSIIYPLMFPQPIGCFSYLIWYAGMQNMTLALQSYACHHSIYYGAVAGGIIGNYLHKAACFCVSKMETGITSMFKTTDSTPTETTNPPSEKSKKETTSPFKMAVKESKSWYSSCSERLSDLAKTGSRITSGLASSFTSTLSVFGRSIA
ncbi:MAG: hypothetical protein HEEMFOPI_00521 [Holosporales bacterium]